MTDPDFVAVVQTICIIESLTNGRPDARMAAAIVSDACVIQPPADTDDGAMSDHASDYVDAQLEKGPWPEWAATQLGWSVTAAGKLGDAL